MIPLRSIDFYDTDVKQCPKCSTVKPSDSFYRDKNKRDRRSSLCKECTRAAVRKYRASDKGKAKEAEYFSSDKFKEAQKRFRSSDKGKAYIKRYTSSDKHKQYLKQYRQTKACKEANRRGHERYRATEAGQIKNKAREKTRTALRSGKLERLPCEVCGSTDKVESHHPDYSKPLEVLWLCKEHHAQAHN